MTDTEIQPRLWGEGGFREDRWRQAEELEATSNAPVILPPSVLLALSEEQRAARRGAIGVLLQPADAVETIVPLLPDLGLVALAFPAFNDGRSYSKAELLRRRLGYDGPLRAVGDVLIDQIPLMLRTGFTEFEVKNPTALARLEQGKLGGIAQHYQPTASDASAAPAGSYSWRRQG